MPAVAFEKAFPRIRLKMGQYTYQAMPTPAEIEVTGYSSGPFATIRRCSVCWLIFMFTRPIIMTKQSPNIRRFSRLILKALPPLRGLGYAYLQSKDYDKAADYFQRAVKLNSKDPRVHYYVALLKSREHGNTFDFTDSQELPEVISELETAISLDPTFADSYSLMAFAYAANHEREKGLTSMQKALTRSVLAMKLTQFNYGADADCQPAA